MPAKTFELIIFNQTNSGMGSAGSKVSLILDGRAPLHQVNPGGKASEGFEDAPLFPWPFLSALLSFFGRRMELMATDISV